MRLARSLAEEGNLPVLVTSGDWPDAAWPNEEVMRVDGSSPLLFAEAARSASAGCDVVFSLERIASCDVYRAGDGVHRSWLERRALFEPRWRTWLRRLNPKHRQLLRLERELFSTRGAGFVIANSTLVADEIVTTYGYPRERICIVPNGYDAPPVADGLRERRRAELGIAPSDFVALFAGSGWERKGVGAAIAAVQAVPETRLIVAGKGRRRPTHDPRRVAFLGPREDLQSDFAAADVFVLPTRYDPFSNACLEALAAGLPVVTTDANGFSEIITHRVHGSVVPVGSIGTLAEELAFWRESGRAMQARRACEALAARYSVAENSRRTLDVLRRAARK